MTDLLILFIKRSSRDISDYHSLIVKVEMEYGYVKIDAEKVKKGVERC